MSGAARDWLWFLAAAAALSAVHIATAFASGMLPTEDPIDGLLFYAGKGWFGPIVGLAYAGLAAIVSRAGRPGRSALRAAIVVGALAYISASETRALLPF